MASLCRSLRFFWLFAAVTACGGSGGGGGGGAPDGGGLVTGTGGGSGSSGSSGSGGNAGQDGSNPSSSVCAEYIDCVSQAMPSGLAAVLAAYGKTGSCWAEGDPSLCESACHAGIVAAHKASPSIEACNACDSSADCPATLPACAEGHCVECLADADCSESGMPACDVATHACVACTASFHCKDPGKPACDTASKNCVECTSSADCSMSAKGPACDAVSHQCRACASNGECGSGVCSNGYCVQCASNADCPATSPHCSNGVCIQCQNDSECAPGVCNVLGGTCCGKTACASMNAECGEAIDLACIFTPIPCGACASGHTCVMNKCQPTPAKTCSNSSCASGHCGYVPANNDYECIANYSTCTQNTDCSAGYACESKQDQVTGQKYYACIQYCLIDADCSPGVHCALLEGPTSYGTCDG